MKLAPTFAFTLLGATPITYESGNAHVMPVELFSSEGCRNCPRGEARSGALETGPDLRQKLVPVVFHVGYRDRPGWAGRFAGDAQGPLQAVGGWLVKPRRFSV